MKNIIIIGKGNGWREAPKDGETWGVNDLFLKCPLKLTFEMHDLLLISTDASVKRALSKAEEDKVPVMMLDHYDQYPTSVKYPIDEIIGIYKSDYFSNSISYMIAYALYVGATKIDMYGVNMGTQSEYVYEKGSVEFWIGMAMGLGVEVKIHGQDTALLRVSQQAYIIKDHLYGYLKPQQVTKSLITEEDLLGGSSAIKAKVAANK